MRCGNNQKNCGKIRVLPGNGLAPVKQRPQLVDHSGHAEENHDGG